MNPCIQSTQIVPVPDLQWFGMRPKRTHRLRMPFSYEIQCGAWGSTHVIVARLFNGPLAKVPVNLSGTCKQCLSQVEAIVDLAEESILDCNLAYLLKGVVHGQQPAIETSFDVGFTSHSVHNE